MIPTSKTSATSLHRILKEVLICGWTAIFTVQQLGEGSRIESLLPHHQRQFPIGVATAHPDYAEQIYNQLPLGESCSGQKGWPHKLITMPRKKR